MLTACSTAREVFSYLEFLAPYRIAWIEELAPPLDFELCKDLAERTESPLATGENLFSRDDARNLLRYGGLRADRDILQFDISLSYGIVEYLRILNDLDERMGPPGIAHRTPAICSQCIASLALASGLPKSRWMPLDYLATLPLACIYMTAWVLVGCSGRWLRSHAGVHRLIR